MIVVGRKTYILFRLQINWIRLFMSKLLTVTEWFVSIFWKREVYCVKQVWVAAACLWAWVVFYALQNAHLLLIVIRSFKPLFFSSYCFVAIGFSGHLSLLTSIKRLGFGVNTGLYWQNTVAIWQLFGARPVCLTLCRTVFSPRVPKTAWAFLFLLVRQLQQQGVWGKSCFPSNIVEVVKLNCCGLLLAVSSLSCLAGWDNIILV